MDPFHLGDWSVEPAEGTITGRQGRARLEPKVMQVLLHLCRQPGQVVSKDDLLSTVWPDTHVQEVALSRAISELRRHLGDNARDPTYIETLPKRGYRVIASIRRQPELVESPAAGPRPPKPPAPQVAHNPRFSSIAALLGLIVVAWIIAWRNADDTPHPRSLAVSSFQSLEDDSRADYFARGIAEDILTRLSQIRRLRVVAVPTELATAPAEEVGRRLRVASVLTGSVRRDGERVRINARLVETESGRHLWGESYDRDLTGLFDIQREVTDRIATALSTELSSQETEQLGQPPTARVTAYDTYLQAREHYRAYRAESNSLAIELYRRALSLDPDFALAHAGLASACVLQVARYGHPEAEWLPSALEAAREAATLDPDLPEAHNALGMLYIQEGRNTLAREAFTRALELRPGYEEARHNAAFLQYPLGRWDAGGHWQTFPETSRLR